MSQPLASKYAIEEWKNVYRGSLQLP